MSSGFAGVPDRPLTEADIRALDQHSAIEFCQPMEHLSGEPDSIVVIALAKSDRAYLLFYNPDDQQWEQLLETELPEAITDGMPFSPDAVNERLLRYYDDEDIEPSEHRIDPVRGVIRGFPDEPLTATQIETIQTEHPMIGDVMPLVDLAEDGGRIALVFFLDDPVSEERITAAAGYDPDIGAWQELYSARSSDPNLDRELEQLRDTYARWVADRYTLDEIDPIE